MVRITPRNWLLGALCDDDDDDPDDAPDDKPDD
jgi:hypothetical protein